MGDFLRNMVERQVRTWEVLDEAVLRLYEKPELLRENFVPEAVAENKSLAYADLQLPIGRGQRMLEPKLEARLLQVLSPKADEDFLHIGTGSGFFAALLGALAHSVVSVEIDEELAAAAQKRLAFNSSVRVVCADGMDGYAARAPYHGIVLTGALVRAPVGLFEQLKTGGRLLAVIGEPPIMTARLFEKQAGGVLSEDVLETCIPPLRDKTLTRAFQF